MTLPIGPVARSPVTGQWSASDAGSAFAR